MAKQTVKTSVKTRVKKDGGSKDYVPCNMCHGTGVHKKPKRRKKKS